MPTRKNQLSVMSLLVPLLLVAALLAGLVLVRKSQETRRGAYYAQTKLSLQPESIQKAVGENFSVALFVDTPASVTFVKGTICYDAARVELNYSGTLDSAVTINEEAFKELLLTKSVDRGGKKC